MPEAELDPWCTVAMRSSASVLFGYAHRHPRTGGLAWTRTSAVMKLDEAHGSASTVSGTIYKLGIRFHLDAVDTYGTEARLALRLLLGIGPAPDTIAASLKNVAGAEKWLVACKVARHLAHPCPAPELAQIEPFLLEHGAAYIKLRSETGLR